MSNLGPLYSSMPTTVGHTEHYFAERHIQLDTRGTLKIDPDSKWGFGVKVITLSHSNAGGTEGENWSTTVDRPVIVEAGAWIGSYAILYNCHIGARAVVALGTVVRSQVIASDVMVAGNPARVIARFVGGAWSYLGDKLEYLA